MTKTWDILSRAELLKVGERLRVFQEHVRLPDGREVPDYLQFITQPYVVIVAEIANGHLICERQYKHGARKVILTLPAGIIEPGECPEQAARRELLEETGYVGDSWQFLSEYITNGNAGGGRCHAFLVRNCRKLTDPESDDLEEMEILIKRPEELLAALLTHEMPAISDAAALLPALFVMGYFQDCPK